MFFYPEPFESSFDLNFKSNKEKPTEEDSENKNQVRKGKIFINRNMLEKVHYLMRIFVLRRLKSEVEQTLPFKLETKINCPMTEMQMFWVKLLMIKERELINKVLSSGNTKVDHQKRGKLLSLMQQLRKAANHPYLFPGNSFRIRYDTS